MLYIEKNSNIEVVKKVFSFYSQDYKSLFNKINWIEGDINDLSSFNHELYSGIKKIYHCAAFVSFSIKDTKRFTY